MHVISELFFLRKSISFLIRHKTVVQNFLIFGKNEKIWILKKVGGDIELTKQKKIAEVCKLWSNKN